MRAIMLDVEKIKHCIDGYKDEHGKLPYLIMSSKTKELLPPSSSITLNEGLCVSTSMITNIVTSPESIVIDGKKYILEKNLNKIAVWNECKIMIDDTLEFGEVHIG